MLFDTLVNKAAANISVELELADNALDRAVGFVVKDDKLQVRKTFALKYQLKQAELLLWTKENHDVEAELDSLTKELSVLDEQVDKLKQQVVEAKERKIAEEERKKKEKEEQAAAAAANPKPAKKPDGTDPAGGAVAPGSPKLPGSPKDEKKKAPSTKKTDKTGKSGA